MKLKIIIFILILIISYSRPDYLFSPLLVLIGGFLFLSTKLTLKKSYFKNVKPLLGVFVLGVLGIIGHESRHVFRDVIYALTPISMMYVGYWMADDRGMFPLIFKYFVTIGIIFSIYHLSSFILNPNLIFEKMDEIRRLASNPGNGIILLSLVLGLFHKRFELNNLFPKYIPRTLGISLLALSFILSFSRTNLLMTIIISISILGIITRLNWKFLASSALLISAFIFVIYTTPIDEEGTFRSKMARSMVEITISDYEDMGDIHNNWRGFETYLAVSKFTNGTWGEKIKGFGFGSLVDVGFTMKLFDLEFSQIPILHNGYAYILVKTGLLGILCYLIFYYNTIKYALINNKSKDIEKIFLSRLLLGITLSLIFSMIVIGGMAQIHHAEYVLLLGFILRRIEYI